MSPSSRIHVVTPPQRHRDIIPDSDDSLESLPSLKKLLKRPANSGLTSSSKAVPALRGAITGFQSTSTLLRRNVLDLGEAGQEGDGTKSNHKAKSKPKRTAKVRARSVMEDHAGILETSAAKTGRSFRGTATVKAIEDSVLGATVEAITVTSSVKAQQSDGKHKRPKKRKSDEGVIATNGNLVVIECTDLQEAAHRNGSYPTEPLQFSLTQAEVYDPAEPKAGKRRKMDTHRAAEDTISKGKPRQKTAKVSCHFSAEMKFKAEETADTASTKCALDPEPVCAVKRRKEWTRPTKDQSRNCGMSHAEELKICEVPSSPRVRPRMTKSGSDNKRTASGESVGENCLSPSQPEAACPRFEFAGLHEAFGYHDDPALTSASGAVRPERIDRLSTDKEKNQSNGRSSELPRPVSAPTYELQFAAQTAKALPSKASPTKRYKSITDRVVARYQAPESGSTINQVSPHFAPVFSPPINESVAQEVAVEHATNSKSKPAKPRKSRQKAGQHVKSSKPKKIPKSKAKVRPAILTPQKLVSPSAFARRIGRQEVLFGTSSQLNLNEDPAVLVEIQRALRESELETVVEEEHMPSSPVVMHTTIARRRTRPNLWAAAETVPASSVFPLQKIVEMDEAELPWERNGAESSAFSTSACEQSLVDVDDVVPLDMIPVIAFRLPVQTPELPLPTVCQSTKQEVSKQLPRATGHASGNTNATDAWHHVDICSSPTTDLPFTVSRSEPLSTVPTVSRLSSSPPTHITSFTSTTLTRPALRPLSQNSNMQRQAAKFSSTNYVSESSASTPKKLRGQPQIASPKPGPSPNGGKGKEQQSNESKAAETPKRRGRPPKQSSQNLGATPGNKSTTNMADGECFRNIDDIEDSEVDRTPTPPRRRGRPPSTPPLPLTTTTEQSAVKKRSNTAIVNERHPRWPTVSEKLFPEITSTVRSVPRSFEPKNPTWHEKMLLYDPIVLEDLTAWLNQCGLKVEGKDKKLVDVSAWMVQIWCERNSVCCLWMEGGSSWRNG